MYQIDSSKKFFQKSTLFVLHRLENVFVVAGAIEHTAARARI